MTDILKIVGGNIRKQRKLRRLTLEKLAEKSESNPKYLGAVERGEENIGVKKLQQVAGALKVDAFELLFPGGDDKAPDELIALIKSADLATQSFLLDFVKRIPEWEKAVRAANRRKTPG